jgi:hypothetical protein
MTVESFDRKQVCRKPALILGTDAAGRAGAEDAGAEDAGAEDAGAEDAGAEDAGSIAVCVKRQAAARTTVARNRLLDSDVFGMALPPVRINQAVGIVYIGFCISLSSPPRCEWARLSRGAGGDCALVQRRTALFRDR